MKKPFQRHAAFMCIALFGTSFAAQAQSQAMTAAQVEAVLTSMSGQPVPLFFGLPLEFEALTVSEAGGDDAAFDVVLAESLFAGLPLGDLSFNAREEASGSLRLSTDLAPVLTEILPELDSTFEVEQLQLSMSINPEAQSTERLEITVQDLLFAEAGAEDENNVKLGALSFLFDEGKQNPLSVADFSLQDLSAVIDGAEIGSLESFGFHLETVNTPDWFLQREINEGFKQFAMFEAGLISPLDAAANVIDRFIPLFESDLQDLASSFDMGKLTLNDLDLLDFDGRLDFGGFSIKAAYDHAAKRAKTDGTLGRLQVVASSSWSDEVGEFNLLDMQGGSLSGSTTYTPNYDLNPLGDVFSDLSAQVRMMDVEDFFDPEEALWDIYLSVGGKLLAWSADAISANELELKLDSASIEVPESDDERFRLSMSGAELVTGFNFEPESDVQNFAARLMGLNVEMPEQVGFSLGEVSAGYRIRDSFASITEIVLGLENDDLTLADGLRFFVSSYLPNFTLGAKDAAFYVATPTGTGAVSGSLAAADISFTTQDMLTDQATIQQHVSFAGLDVVVDDEIAFDPVLIDLLLGRDEPGLLPTDVSLTVELAELPMAMILNIASNVPLPSLETMRDPDFDPSSLLFAGAALVSPLLASPPSLIVQPSKISGGMVEATASGSVAINPLLPPNYSVGSITMTMLGVAEAQAEIIELMKAIESGAVDVYPGTAQTVEQVLEGLFGASMLGVPTNEGALEFVLDIPAGESPNINGLMIPLPF